MINDAERQLILFDWNETGRDYPLEKSLHQLFEEQVERTPDACAALFSGNSITYRELNLRANRISTQLRRLNVGPEGRVGVCLDRSFELLIAIIGILKAGAAYVPLDPNYPEERLGFIAEDAAIQVLVTRDTVLSQMGSPAGNTPVVSLDENFIGLDSENRSGPFLPSQLAYLIYTSGSTGKPKGVAIEHRSVVSFVHWIRESFTDEELAGVLGATSICFDLSVFEMFGSLCWGGTIILVDQALDLVSCPHRDSVTLVNTVPSVAAALLKAQAFPPSVITVNLAGEPLSTMLVDALYKQSHIRSVNDLYGPTETTVYSTWTRREPRQIATIGRPLANTVVYVLDDRLQPVSLGMTGELWIGGSGVARGYWQRPDLTAERFLPNPFSTQIGDRIYRTGDLARWRPDGQLEYLGRADHQIKLRGYRIELGEIEAAMHRIPDLSASVVVPRTKTSVTSVEDITLVAFVVAVNHETPSVVMLRSSLTTTLPEYMIPAQFILVRELPLTANGKLDRKRLMLSPVDELGGFELTDRQDYVAPRNQQERAITEIWQSVTGQARVGIHDRFFELGGHSLQALVISSRITALLGRSIPARSIFEFPTIAQLCRQLDATVDQLDEFHPIPAASCQDQYPLSFGQQGLWLIQAMLSDRATYNEPMVFRVTGQVDRERLRSAMQSISQRHDILRTALVQDGDSLVQRVLPFDRFSVPLREISLRDLPNSSRDRLLQTHLLDEVRQPFDLAQAPLWRGLWIDRSESEGVLVLTFHHSIVDEWSNRLIVQELATFYAAGEHRREARIPELPIQYGDYATWQRAKQNPDQWQKQFSYWSRQLADLPAPLELPTDRPRPLVPSDEGAIYTFSLKGPVINRLRELARAEATTLFSVLLAGFQICLYRHTAQTDFIVGTPNADRQHPDVQSLIGYFLNMLPIRSRLEPDQSFGYVLSQLKQTLRDAFAHADFPFEQMVKIGVTERQSGRLPLFQVMFVLLEELPGNLCLGDATAEPFFVHTRTSKSDLTLDIQASGDEWICRLEYATDLFSHEAASRLADHFSQLMQSIASDPECPIGRLNLMGAEERQMVVVEWNETRRDYANQKSVPQLFEEQVKQTPDAIAVEFGDQSLTYAELNSQSNRLARYLRSQGVIAETLVGISVERSFEMIVGLLAILKAGSAYVPLDPHYPAERLSLLVADTCPALILTQSALEPRWRDSGRRVVCLDQAAARWSDEGDDNLEGTVTGDSLAYVIYTSGSTGVPKGVEVLHRGIVRLLCSANYVQLDQTQSVLQLAVLSFDASTFEIWGPLLHGGRCVLAPPRISNLAELRQLLRDKHVRTLWLTSTLFNTVVDSHLSALEGVEQLLVGGEALSVPHVRKALRHLGDRTQLINGYGPTECTTFACCHRLPSTIPEDCRSIPIGRPISNTTTYVLDSSCEPVPIGVSGELYVGGDGVARGYLNHPELTSEKFVRDPFSDRPSARMYRTGDLARWLPDGTIEFLGRRDEQVKLRGFRIELGEIKATLSQHPDVQQSEVVVREDRPGDKRLVAYVVLQCTLNANAIEGLQRFLQEQLPPYMIPSAIVPLAEIPRTANGKVDRRSLPVPGGQKSDQSESWVAPQSPEEVLLTGIWERVLGVDRIGIHDNFFERGGHSLMALRVIDEVNQSFGSTLKISDLFSHPTIAGLTSRLAEPSESPSFSSTRQYLEPIHQGVGRTHLVIVGATVRVSRNEIPPEISVWWLKLDGLHVWPHQHWDIPTQARVHVAELLTAIPCGRILLCGHSFGGLLAIEIAHQLQQVTEQRVDLILLEPSPAWNTPESLGHRLVRHARAFLKPGRLGRIQHLIKSISKKSERKILQMRVRMHSVSPIGMAIEDRWNYMAPHFVRLIRKYQLPESLDSSIHLIGIPDYLESAVPPLRHLTSGTVTVHPVPEELSHLDLARSHNNHYWIGAVLLLNSEKGFSNFRP